MVPCLPGSDTSWVDREISRCIQATHTHTHTHSGAQIRTRYSRLIQSVSIGSYRNNIPASPRRSRRTALMATPRPSQALVITSICGQSRRKVATSLTGSDVVDETGARLMADGASTDSHLINSGGSREAVGRLHLANSRPLSLLGIRTKKLPVPCRRFRLPRVVRTLGQRPPRV